MENVLIWPKEYPLLVKGLVEQNGAFILDALEAWPACRSTEEDNGVCTTVLPPIYYLTWLTPLEPFEECYFQHISEYDENAQEYIAALKEHYFANDYSIENIVLMLCQRLEKYASVSAQNNIETPLSLISLFFSKRFFTLIEHALEQGAKLSAEDTLAIWKEVDFRERLSAFLPESVADVDSIVLLENALLAHLNKKKAKQTMAMRFIEQGATGTLTDTDDKTAFMWAAEKGYVNVVETLLQYQDKKAVDGQGNTALHYAVISKNESLMILLLKAGYDFRARNNEGLSCYRLAVSIKASNLVKCLERDFGIKELSPEGQLERIKKVHVLHAVVALLLPLQLFFFFDENITIKSELTLFMTMTAVVCFFFATNLKRCSLYPHVKHPWGLFLIRMMSVFSLVAQLGLACIVGLAALSELV